MKLTIVLVVCAAAICAAEVVRDPEAVPTVPGDNSHYVEGVSRYIWMSDGEVENVLVDLQEPVDTELIDEITRNPNNNVYLLFTRRNRLIGQTLVMNNANSIHSSNFNPTVPTVVAVHGWLSSRYTEPNPTIQNAFLNKSDVNIIVLCWRALAASSYITAANGVPAVGRGLGEFLEYLHRTTGASLNQMHLIGFSLGAHVVGNAGRVLGGRVARVTGLDPAGPQWNAFSARLRSSDGVYVEAIHSDGGYALGGLGIGSAIADADFFPNGGISQPGCYTNLCNHNRAWELYAASVTHNHLVGQLCTSNLQITLNTCRGQSLHMGNDDLRKSGRGMYRLDTGRRYPY